MGFFSLRDKIKKPCLRALFYLFRWMFCKFLCYLFWQWNERHCTYVVSFRVSISNSWLKELLVCACVSIFHLQRKRFYKDLHTFFFNAWMACVKSYAHCTMFKQWLSWCYVESNGSLFVIAASEYSYTSGIRSLSFL